MTHIQLPSLFQDHMMLQRDKPLHLWGQAAGLREILIELGKDRQTVTVEDGAFSCLFPPQPAGRDQVLTFSAVTDSGLEVVRRIRGIRIGDIWMACGQSNMEYFLRYDAHWQDTVRTPRQPDIRMFNVPQLCYEGEEKHLPHSGYWFGEGDSAWPEFSAPGYSFARHLQKSLQVPVGIIGCNWGGTPACAWMDEAHLEDPELSVFRQEYDAAVAPWDPEELRRVSLEAIAFENSYRHGLEWRAMMYGMTREEQLEWMKEHDGDPELPMGPYHHYRPSGLYHTMIETVAPFTIKGFLWYQGESDSGHAYLYRRTMAALIDCFRKTWQDETLPFLFVQLAPFSRWLNCDGAHYTEVRKSQEYVSRHVPGTAMASIMDLGMHDDIHPKHKMEVGRRLALLARGHVYGEDILCDPPVCRKAERNGARITLWFDHAGEGLHDDGRGVSAFVCTQNGREVPVTGFELQGDRVLLTVELPTGNEGAQVAGADGQAAGRVDKPADHADTQATVRIDYAQADYCEVHLWSSAGLAAKPFTVFC